MENMILSQELEEMRSQVAILKQKLDKQTIISESHIRNSMKSKRADMARINAAAIIIGALSAPYCTWIFSKYGFSLAFIIATDIMLAVCIYLTYRQRNMLKNLDFSQNNLVDVAETLNKVKKHYHGWYKKGIPMLLVWYGWMAYEAITKMGGGPTETGFIVGSAVGVIVGSIIGYYLNTRIVKKSTEILNQIKELQNS